MILYRPIGLKELRLIEETQFEKYPPRLYWQPIFYPVLTEEYARKIAGEWNTKDINSDYCGFVTRFTIEESYISKFEVKVVGDSSCQELWVPAEELEEFNSRIQGKIEIIASYYGDKFQGDKPY